MSENSELIEPQKKRLRILGIDPGSRITGYGVIEMDGYRYRYIASGCIRIKSENFPERLKEIYVGVDEVISEYQPTIAAVEQVFVKLNVGGALKLGQARGAAICACVMRSLDVGEYMPNQIKKAVVGRGHATKEQIQHMVVTQLNLNRAPQSDAADALAIALCHAQTYRTVERYSQRSSGARR